MQCTKLSSLIVTGRTVEVYAGQPAKYVSTLRGVASHEAEGCFNFEESFHSGVDFPLSLKVLSLPKKPKPDTSGDKVEAAVKYLSVDVVVPTSPEPKPPTQTMSNIFPPPPQQESMASSGTSLPPAMIAHLMMEKLALEQKVASLETRMSALESSTRREIDDLKSTITKLASSQPTKRTFKVFVYGTLKRGFTNHSRYLSEATQEFGGAANFLHKAQTFIPMVLTVGDYGIPFMFEPTAGVEEEMAVASRIEGELWEVDEEKLGHLHDLESVDIIGDWYDCVKTEVRKLTLDGDGKELVWDEVIQCLGYVSVGERGRKALDEGGGYKNYSRELHEKLYVSRENRNIAQVD